jgi:hypothetical protein
MFRSVSAYVFGGTEEQKRNACIKSNIDARSRNYRRRGKAINITYSVSLQP